MCVSRPESMQSKGVSDSNSPLTSEQAGRLNQLVESLAPDQALWISGYLAGLHAAGAGTEAPSQPADAAPTLTILYGSETGNAERVAEQAGEYAESRGLTARVQDMADYRPRDLKKEKFVLLVTATHGEGQPPDPAEEFYEFLHSRKAPKLPDTAFAVLSLGDSSYEYFCQTGKDLDARLAELGAERIADRVDCDVDYDEPAGEWIRTAVGALAERMTAAPAGDASNVVSFTGQGAAAEAPAYGRDNPFPAEVLENLKLTGRGSSKETRHLELSLEDSGLAYEPGDVLCVVAENRSREVEDLLAATGLDGDTLVEGPRGEVTLAEALRRDYEITTLTPPFLKAYAELAGSDELQRLLTDTKALADYRWGRHILDVVREFPAEGLTPQGFVAMLRKLQPREYSIASSYNANPDEVHLTVAAVRYNSYGRERHGVASTHLADQVEPGDTVPVYVRRNKNFKLPSDPDTSIIMVGPGTGVAPFRAFVEEREYQGAGGRNWLFFGEQHFRTDFLYQIEWQRWLRQGVLTRLDLAFSRDQAEKRYVQHRLLEQGRDLYAWLQEGASFYVCGDAERMAPDVHDALQRIVAREGGLSAERAADYVKTLQREKRYQRDVY